MARKDLFLTVASLAMVLIILLAGAVLAIFMFTAGSPIMLVGVLGGLGLMGLVAAMGLLAAMAGVWYIIYALLDNWLFSKKSAKPESGNYTLGRVKKA